VNLPPAIRGVRGAYFAKTVEPEELSRVGNLASCAGLFGGFMGPLTSVAVNKVVGSEADYDDWFNAFTASASISLGLFVVCLVGLAVTLDAPKKKNSDSNRSFAYDQKSKENRICERCDRELSPEEMTLLQPLCDKCFRRRCERCNRPFSNEELEKQLENQTALCDGCWDNFGGPDKSWKKFRLEVLVSFCVLSMLLELGMNAAVIATFQPLAVGHFRWGNNAIAAVNFMGAGLVRCHQSDHGLPAAGRARADGSRRIIVLLRRPALRDAAALGVAACGWLDVGDQGTNPLHGPFHSDIFPVDWRHACHQQPLDLSLPRACHWCCYWYLPRARLRARGGHAQFFACRGTLCPRLGIHHCPLAVAKPGQRAAKTYMSEADEVEPGSSLSIESHTKHVHTHRAS